MDGAEESLKVIIVGDGNVGKTSMLRRFVKGEFVEQYKKTIGAEFMEKDVFLRELNQTVKLMLWDTAGQEVFNALTQGYYRDSAAAIVAFSTVDRDSFMNVDSWRSKVESVCGSITMVLCQTKFDLSNEAAVSNEEAEQLAIRLGMPFFRTSTKDDFNVTQLFEYTAQQSLSAINQAENTANEQQDVNHQGNAAGVGEAAANTGLKPDSAAVHSNGTTAQTDSANDTSRPAGHDQPGGGNSSNGGGGGEKTDQGEKADHKHKSKKTVTLREPESHGEKKKKKKRCTIL